MLRHIVLWVLILIFAGEVFSQSTPSYSDLIQVMNKRTNEYNLVMRQDKLIQLIHEEVPADSLYVKFGCYVSIDGWYASSDTLYIDTCYVAGGPSSDSIYLAYGCYDNIDYWIQLGDTVFIDTCFSTSDSVCTSLYEEQIVAPKTVFPVQFTIDTISLVFLNGIKLKTSQWTGMGTDTLTLLLNTIINDEVTLISFGNCQEGSGNVTYVDNSTNYYVSGGAYKEELPTAKDTIPEVGFTLNNTCVISYNGTELKDSQWTGIGSDTLILYVDVRQYDFLTIKQ